MRHAFQSGSSAMTLNAARSTETECLRSAVPGETPGKQCSTRSTVAKASSGFASNNVRIARSILPGPLLISVTLPQASCWQGNTYWDNPCPPGLRVVEVEVHRVVLRGDGIQGQHGHAAAS